MKRPIEIIHDVLVKVDLFLFPTDFVIIDFEVEFEVPIILKSSFLDTGHALVNMEKRQMKILIEQSRSNFEYLLVHEAE